MFILLLHPISPHGLSPPVLRSQMSNTRMILFLLLVLSSRCIAFCALSNMRPASVDFSLLKPEKCQLLQLHTNLPIHLSPTVDPHHPCPCLTTLVLATIALAPQLLAPPSVFWTQRNILGLVSPAMLLQLRTVIIDSLKLLERLAHSLQFLLTLPSQLNVGSMFTLKLFLQFSFLGVSPKYILLRKLSNSTPFTTEFSDKFLALKAHNYHRVIIPSLEECSNAYLLSLAFQHAPRLLIPSQRISVQRLRYLGHIVRHFDSVEHKMIFHPSHSLRRLSSPVRHGRPRARWPEIALAEAYHRGLLIQQHQHPSTQDVQHPIYQVATTATVQQYLGPSLSDWYDTTRIYRALQPVAEDRAFGDQIVFPGK